MKLLVLSSRFPYPLNKGDKLRMYHQIQDLAKVYEVVLVSITDEYIPDAHKKLLEKICSQVYLFRLSWTSICLNIIQGALKGWPIQVSYFFNQSIQRQINKIIEKTQPGHIYSQLIRTAEYVRESKLEKTLDYMDCFSMNSAKRAETSTGLIKLFWEWESKKVRKYEAEIYPFFTNHTIISNTDAGQMPQACMPVSIIPNGIGSDFFTSYIDENRDIDLLFVGNLSYYSNVEAVHFLVKNIIPYLGKSLKIVIAGAHPSASVKLLFASNKNVELLPNVTDIKSIYSRAKIFIAPITKGTGMQNKILEAIASGCEVICSKEVSDGLGFKLNTVHIALNASAYVSAIGTLLSHFKSHISQRENSRNFVAKEFSWQDKSAELIDIINKDKR